MSRSDAFHVYDTTLRDGAQREGISYSVEDKLIVTKLLDEFGVSFIEGGWPGALPKDTEFFARMAAGEVELKNAKLVAFGATRKAGISAAEDPQVQALLDSKAPVITLVAKSDIWHVEQALKTTPEENLAMIADTVALLTANGRRVFVDFEHFFDGYKHAADYGVSAIKTAIEAGADVAVLCDTNGGMLPSGIHTIVTDVIERTGARIGIHCQDDTGCAIANTIAAVEAGATHVQCTANGYGERTGNADLFSVVANIELKLGVQVLPDGALQDMVRVSHAIAEIANLTPDTHQPYVGVSSFAHKAGLHASALKVNQELYNHIDAALVGNDMRVLVTEMAGRASIELKGKELGYDLSQNPEAISKVVEQVKNLEAKGWSFEAADASFELLLQSALTDSPSQQFTVTTWQAVTDQQADGTVLSEATVSVQVGDEIITETRTGNGPVNALDNALRTALLKRFPELASLELVDYKVRILDGGQGTGAVTRVLIETAQGSKRWNTVGVHENVIAASWLALEDAITYGLLTHDETAK
ncbi:MAG: citramalate synthase [Actinomycetales bacterium]|nr:citramalate synthase [Actinomycetales bacterium]